MRRATFAFLVAASFCLTALGALAQAARPPQPCASSVRYGENALAGQRATVNGISMYYETYGKGPPLLLIHGNGGSIDAMRCQIEHFSRSYRVIAADNRSHGKTDNGPGALTYEEMTDDLAALLEKLKIEKIDIIGQSDGAILALLLAMRCPSKVRALVASGPNLRPDAVADWAVAWIEKDLKNVEATNRKIGPESNSGMN